MKDTIKKDKQRIIMKEEYLTDNALMEYVKESEDKIIIDIRYISFHRINEIILTQMLLDDYQKKLSSLLRISEDGKTIAIFKEVEEGYQLDRVYEIEEQSFVIDSFKDIAYQEKFPKEKLNKQLIKRK